MKLRVLRLWPELARLPQYATPDAAGLDLSAALDKPLSLLPGGWTAVPTGLAVALPVGFEGQIRPRSGLAARHGVTVLNAPGTIDADYRGEIRVLLINHGTKVHAIQPGDRIAQLVIAPVQRVDVEEVSDPEMLGDTERGDGGFGSTGR